MMTRTMMIMKQAKSYLAIKGYDDDKDGDDNETGAAGGMENWVIRD